MRHTTRLILALGAAASGLACSSAFDITGEPGTPVPVTRLRAEPYSFASYSGLRQATQVVVRDDVTWQAVWAAIAGSANPTPQRPSVDFQREMIVVAALGERGSGGFDILVESARTTSRGLVVTVHVSAPGATCLTTQALTQPVDVARLPLSAGAVVFTDVSTVTNCR